LLFSFGFAYLLLHFPIFKPFLQNSSESQNEKYFGDFNDVFEMQIFVKAQDLFKVN